MRFEGRSRISTRLDMAPLIDVVFLLLIFFLLTSTYSEPRAIELELPEAESAATAPELPLVVSLAADGTLYIDDEPLAAGDNDALRAAISEALAGRRERALTLEADAGARYERVVEILDTAGRAGAEGVALATRPPGPKATE